MPAELFSGQWTVSYHAPPILLCLVLPAVSLSRVVPGTECVICCVQRKA